MEEQDQPHHQTQVQDLDLPAQPQSPTASAHNPWAAEARLEAHLQQRQALVAVQDLEHQRLKLLQDSAASPPL